MKLTPRQIRERFEKLKSDRQMFESHWQELADYILPNKNDIQKTYADGQKRNTHLYDSTGPQACTLLANALHGMLTNPASTFFELTTGDEELDLQDDVRMFLQDVSRKAHSIINRSNFQTEIHEVYMDLAAFGTAALLIEEDDDKTIRFQAEHIRSIFVDESNTGLLDEIYRSVKWTAKKIYQEFGEKNLPKKILDAHNQGSSEEFELVHAIYPEMETEKVKGVFRFHSHYIWLAEEFELRHHGFRTLPIVVPRWTKTSSEVYGRSAGMNALPDVKMINEIMRTMIKAAQKTVDPPLMAPDDGFVMPIITKPGGMNYYRAGSQDRIEPFANEAKFDFGQQIMAEMRTRIRDCFFIDQLQLNQGPQMTATEVNQRTEEKMRLLGPVLGRQQSELLAPLIDRLMEIMFRKEIIKKSDIPTVLSGRFLDVKYSSLIAKAQRTGETQNVMRAIQVMSPFIQMMPTATDQINSDNAVRMIGKVFGWPQELFNDQDEVKKIREQRAQAQQAALSQVQQGEQLDNAQKVADIASTTGKA